MHSHYTIPIQCTSSGGNKLAKMTTKPFVLEFTFTAYTLECSVCLFVCIRACALLSLWNRFVKITAFKSNLNDFIQFKQFKWFSLHRWSAKQKQATVFLPLFISFELSFSISISRLPPFRWWYSCVFGFRFCLTLDFANRDFLSHCATEQEKKKKRKRAFSQRFNSNQFHNYVHKYKARRIQTLSCRHTHTHKRQRKSRQRFKISTFWRIAWQSFYNECVIFGAKSAVNFACKTILSIIFHLPNNLHSNLFGWLGNETAEKCEFFHHNVMFIVESGPFRMSQIVILCTECLLLTSSLLTLLYIFGCFMLISPFKVISKRSIFKRQ